MTRSEQIVAFRIIFLLIANIGGYLSGLISQDEFRDNLVNQSDVFEAFCSNMDIKSGKIN